MIWSSVGQLTKLPSFRCRFLRWILWVLVGIQNVRSFNRSFTNFVFVRTLFVQSIFQVRTKPLSLKSFKNLFHIHGSVVVLIRSILSLWRLWWTHHCIFPFRFNEWQQATSNCPSQKIANQFKAHFDLKKDCFFPPFQKSCLIAAFWSCLSFALILSKRFLPEAVMDRFKIFFTKRSELHKWWWNQMKLAEKFFTISTFTKERSHFFYLLHSRLKIKRIFRRIL